MAFHDLPADARHGFRWQRANRPVDGRVGAALLELREAGLAEDTIVFFYGDHGAGLPRNKRSACDSGLRVPLLVRFPEKWRHLAPADILEFGAGSGKLARDILLELEKSDALP